MDIVTGHVGSAHVTSWQDRDLNQGIFGPDTYILNVGSKLAATIISNNEIRIADGTLVMQGCQGVIQKGTYDTISIDNGTQGLKRNDLICAQYTKSAGVESMSLVVIKGTAASTPVDPSYTTGDIQNGDALVQVPIYRVVLNGLTVESVTALVNEVGTISGSGDPVSYSAGKYCHSGTTTTLTTISLSEGRYMLEAEMDSEDIDNSIIGYLQEAVVGDVQGIVLVRNGMRQGLAKNGLFWSGILKVVNATVLTLKVYQNSGAQERVDYSIQYTRV